VARMLASRGRRCCVTASFAEPSAALIACRSSAALIETSRAPLTAANAMSPPPCPPAPHAPPRTNRRRQPEAEGILVQLSAPGLDRRRRLQLPLRARRTWLPVCWLWFTPLPCDSPLMLGRIAG
jgi:hypothetical protein